jgi:hypothetical protein
MPRVLEIMRAHGRALDVALAAVFAFMTMGAAEFPCEGDHHHDAGGVAAPDHDGFEAPALPNAGQSGEIESDGVPHGIRTAGGHECHCLCHVPGTVIAGTAWLRVQVIGAFDAIVPCTPDQDYTSRLFRPPSSLLAVAA